MPVRFLHLADVHLDTAFLSRDQQLRSLLRQSLREAFQRAIDTAIDQQLDAVLVSGDLFDNGTLSFATERFLTDELNKLAQAGIQFIYAPGNHDPYRVGYRCHQIPWPENVHVFTDAEPDRVCIKGKDGSLQAIVVGAAHQNLRESQNLAQRFPVVQDSAVPHIAMLHCIVTGSSGSENHDRYAPCELNDLLGKGYSYWALGHVHRPQQLADDPYIVYAGNIMGRHPGETGPRGGYLVHADLQQVTVKFLPCSPICWIDLTVTGLLKCSNFTELEQLLIAAIEAKLQQQSAGMRPLVRTVLSGPCPLAAGLNSSDNLEALADSIQAALGLDYLEIEARGVIFAANPQQYSGEPHLLGKALELWQRALEDDTMLEQIAPKTLAGVPASAEKIPYLRKLLQGLDSELVVRLLKEEQ